jgi:hypothetical protein
MKYRIIEDGEEVATATSKSQWEKIVRGLNSAMDVIDAPYPRITVKRSDGKIVYRQKSHSP